MALKTYLFFLKIFIFSIFFLGSLLVGPYSYRIYFSVITFVFLLFKKNSFKSYKEINIYIAFILLYLYALFVNDGIYSVDFIKFFLSTFFVCFVTFYAALFFIKSKQDLNSVLFYIYILGVVNALVSVLQYLGNSFAISLTVFFNPTIINASKSDVLDRFIDNDTIGLGAFGLFSSSVANGYFSIIPCILSVYFFRHCSGVLNKVMLILLLFISFFGLFVVQQRFVMLLTLCFFIYYIYRASRYFFPLLILLSFVSIFLAFEFLNFQDFDLGRFSSFEDHHREHIYSKSIDFVFDNFWFGGQDRLGNILMYSHNVNSSHNFFLNAFVFSGFFGAIVIIYLYFFMVYKCFKNLKNINTPQFYISIILLIFFLNALTHNRSLITGDEVIWLFYGLLFSANKYINDENTFSNR